MNCGELLVSLLERYGVEVVFGIPGTHTIELYRGLAQSELRHITPRHEQGAGFMADGYARATGKVAACFTVSGPGALNIATAMGQALQDSVPMLVISADNRRHERGLGEGRLHETRNLQAAMAECSAWSHTLMRPDELPRVLARAFAIFYSGRPGPVHLSLPMDVIVTAADHVSPQPWPISSRPAAPKMALAEAALRLNEAVRPVIALGGGAVTAAPHIRALAETLDAPVTVTHNARGLLPPDHELLVATSPSSEAVRALYRQSDLVLGIGTEFSETDYDFQFDGGFALDVDLIRIDIDSAQLCRNVRPVLPICADSGLALEGLLPLLEPREREGAARTRATLARVSEHHAGYQRFLDTLCTALPEAILVADSTQPAYYAAAQYHPTQARAFASAATGYGTLGYALPAACGARLGQPGRPVVALLGDGGLQFCIAELASAVEARLGLAVIVWNNARYDMIARNFEAAGMAPIACDIYTPDLLAIARGYGCVAERARDTDELAESLQRCVGRSVPTLIEVQEQDFIAPQGSMVNEERTNL